jgi:protocatechuate 3,4-dioxygenase alpha subunit
MLALVPADRRSTLIASPKQTTGTTVYHFDIWLQGDRETVFLGI